MRRAITFSLLTLFSWMLIAPFLAPDAEASLPSCCRRHGKHHCMMQRTLGAPGGPARASESCPYRQRHGGAAASRLSRPVAERQASVEVVESAAPPEPREVWRQPDSFDSHPKRGPPIPVA